MSDVLTDAGALGWLVIAGTLVGFVACAGLAAMAFTRRRVPLTALMVLPYLILAVGAFGAFVNAQTVSSAVEAADPANIASVAMSGIWGAMAVDWIARWAITTARWATLKTPSTRIRSVRMRGCRSATAK